MPKTASLSIGGERRQGRHRVLVGGKAVWLTASMFSLLCQLVRARQVTKTGYLRSDPLGDDAVNPVAIHRLRKSIGAHLIETGAVSEYRVRLAPELIEIDDSLCELPSGLLPSGLLADLIPRVPATYGCPASQTQ
jgi:hypothetical protein